MHSLILPDRQPHVRSTTPPPSATPPGVILIGCGAVARLFYQPALLELTRRRALRVLALVDPSEAARTALAAHFPGAQTVASLEAVDAPPGTLAIVASPPRLHVVHCPVCFRHGWHVLCEKPMAATGNECTRILFAAAGTGCLLGVGLYKRFFPSSIYIRELCRGGALGPLRAFDLQEGGPFRWPAATPSFFSRQETSGGVLLDIGAHVLDLLSWWLGEPASLDYADDAMGGVEANALLRLTYPSGITGRIQLSRDWQTRQSYRLEFEKGLVEWKVNEANALTLRINGLPSALQGTLVDANRLPAFTSTQCFIAQLQNMLAAIQGTEPVRVSGEDGARVQRLIESCYANRRWLEQPWLEAAESAQASRLAQSS